MLERMIGAATFNVHTFEAVETDQRATGQAMLVVILVALASGIGTLGSSEGENRLLALILGVILSLVSWAAWAFITYIIGTTLFATPGTHASWGQLARTTGFAQTPGLLRILGIIPGIGGVFLFLAYVWQLAAMVVAVRQALDYQSTWRAVGVVVVGFIIVLVVYAVLFVLFIRQVPG
jgi:hypothetical protein